MKHMRYVIRILSLLSILFARYDASEAAPAPGAGPETTIPKEVTALQGTYTGSWTNFGIDPQGHVVRRMAWTDSMKAQSPVREGGRTYVATMNEMRFEGVPTPMKIDGKEGYLLNPDGKLGDYFIETFGQVYRMLRLSDDVWSYTVAAQPQELSQLGFPAGASGRHVVVKVVNQEEGTETHRITRVTTVNWKDNDGKARWIQYVSLQGVHRRQP